MSAAIDSAYFFSSVGRSISGAIGLAGRATYSVGVATIDVAKIIGDELYQVKQLSAALGQQVIESVRIQIEEEKARLIQEQRAFEVYKSKIKQNEKLTAQYQEKLAQTVLDNVQFFDKQHIEKLKKDKTNLKELETIQLIENKAQQYQNLYFKLMDFNEFFEEKEFEDFFKFYAHFKEGLFKEKLSSIESLLTQEVNAIQSWIVHNKDILKAKLKTRKFNEVFYELEHLQDTTIPTIFKNDLAQWLTQDESAAEMNYAHQLNTYVQLIHNLFLTIVSQSYFKEIQDQVLELMKSVSDLKEAKGQFSLQDRVNMLEKRKNDLQRLIASMSSDQQKVLEYKELFDEQMAAYMLFKKELEIPEEDTMDIQFKPDEAESQLALLDKTNELLAEKVRIQRNKEKALELLRATLNDYRYEFIGSETNRYQGASLLKGYFLDEKGNVLMTTIGSDNISMDIVGVKETGQLKDSTSIFTSEQTLCEVYPSIVKDLGQQGLTLQETFKVPPSLEGTKEITLPTVIAIKHQNKKKSSRKGNRTLRAKTK
jgi:hypothetical protein